MLHKIKQIGGFFPILLLLIAIASIVVINYSRTKVVKDTGAPATGSYKEDKNLAVLLVFNGEHYIEAENLLASIKKNAPNLLPYIQICVSDSNGKDFAIRHKLAWFEMSPIKKTGGYWSHAMNVMTRRKLEAIKYLLEEKHNVLYIDTDIVILKDPLPAMAPQYDLNIQNDLCAPSFDVFNACTGFMYVKSNQQTINFFNAAIQEIVKRNYNRFNDQDAVNLLLTKRNDITVNLLDPCEFPNGCRYFPEDYNFVCQDCKSDVAYIVHNNYKNGIREKMARFAKNGLIFFDNIHYFAPTQNN